MSKKHQKDKLRADKMRAREQKKLRKNHARVLPARGAQAQAGSGDFFCIYSGRMYPESERSKEHIVPYAIGGSNNFVTRDVSHHANNEAGRVADGDLINNFFMAAERFGRGIASEDGHVPNIEFNGTIDIEGQEVRAKLLAKPDSTTELVTYPQVDSNWTTRQFHVSCDPSELQGIAANIERKGAKKGLQFKLLDHVKAEKSVRVDQPTLESRFNFQIDAMGRGFIKMALGTGHHVLGYRWSKGAEADRLREVLRQPGPNVDWNRHQVRGSIWPQAGLSDEMKDTLSVGDDRHVLMVLNLKPLSFFCLLFGKYDAMIQLHAGKWVRGGPAVNDGRVVVIDTRTRAVWELGFIEYLTLKKKGQLPWG